MLITLRVIRGLHACVPERVQPDFRSKFKFEHFLLESVDALTPPINFDN